MVECIPGTYTTENPPKYEPISVRPQCGHASHHALTLDGIMYFPGYGIHHATSCIELLRTKRGQDSRHLFHSAQAAKSQYRDRTEWRDARSIPCNVSLSPDPSNKRKPCHREPGSYHPAKLTCTHPQYICTETPECGLLRRLCVPEELWAADGQGASGRDVRLRLSGSSQCHSNRCRVATTSGQ